jgi:hypothetical protein
MISLVDEILLSNDKTIAVIDGSGVLADRPRRAHAPREASGPCLQFQHYKVEQGWVFRQGGRSGH